MKKRIALLLTLVLVCNLILTGCIPLDKILPCQHEWEDATCLAPLTCTKCEETAGEPLGHAWEDATCTEAKTCSRCKQTDGVALGHTWGDATCTDPEICSTCNATQGSALGHNWQDATCTEPEYCAVCHLEQGAPLDHDYRETVTRAPSCDKHGVMTYTCKHCNDKYTQEVTAATYTSTEIYNLYKSSVGEVLTYDRNGSELALGTCVVYSADGKLITNFHVIENAYSATVKIDGKTYDVKYVLAYDRDIDLAVIQISASGLKPATLCAKDHATGGTVYALGSSRGLELTMSQGIITHSNRVLDGVVYTQHDAAISGGNSGGPLINEFGEVIGINTMTVRDSQNLNFAINISEMDNLVYGTKLTMQQFYDKECNPYLRLKNYIIENGSYYTSSGGYYVVHLGNQYSSDYSSKYSRYAYYYVSDGEITLDMVIDDGDYWLYVTLTEDMSGVYAWDYFDDYGYKMGGTLYANTFDSDTLLGYSYNNISYSSIRSSVRELASTMVVLLAMHIDTDFSAIGITAQDLGFYYF